MRYAEVEEACACCLSMQRYAQKLWMGKDTDVHF